MRDSLTISSSPGKVPMPIDAQQALKTRLGKLLEADRVSIAQLNKCLTVVTQCNASGDRTPLRYIAAERMVSAVAHVGALLQNQPSVNRREATQVLAQIKRGMQALLQKDLLCTKDQAQKQKALVAALGPMPAKNSERALIADLDHLADECAWLHVAASEHPDAIRIRELDRDFEQRCLRLPFASREDALTYWRAADTAPFERHAALARFPFDGPSTHLTLPPLDGQDGKELGGPRYVPICSMEASNWMMIGVQLAQREALRQKLDEELADIFDVQASKSAQTHARDSALLPYMATANGIAKKQKLLTQFLPVPEPAWLV